MKNLHAQVFFLTNVKLAALNNAGKSKASKNDNAIATKKIYVDGNAFPYMAGQSYGRALRDTLYREPFNWNPAPLLRGEKTVTIVANPIVHEETDMFGYVIAEKTLDLDESGEVRKDSKNRDKTIDSSVSRKAPVSKRALRSVGPLNIARHFSSMSRHEGAPVPYQKEEYAGCLEGGISVNCFSAGTFSDFNKTGYKNITDLMKEEALANGCTEINDPIELNDKGLPQKLIRLPLEIRSKRIIDVIQAPRYISGGAMQTNNMEDITYDFAIFYSLSTGNHLFGNIMSDRIECVAEETPTIEGEQNVQRIVFNKSRIILNVEAIREELWDYRNQIMGTVFIGKRAGFLDEYSQALQDLIKIGGTPGPNGEEYPLIKFGSIGDMCDDYCKQLKSQIL